MNIHVGNFFRSLWSGLLLALALSSGPAWGNGDASVLHAMGLINNHESGVTEPGINR